MRTTLRIDTPILDEVKQIQRRQGGSLGRVVTELLSEALAGRSDPAHDATRLEWIAKPMRARVDLLDRDAVFAILDDGDPPADP